MTQALILNGAPVGHAALERATTALGDALRAKGWVPKTVTVRNLKIAPCKGCFHCWTRTPGLCEQMDDAQPLAKELAASDLLALVTPISFGGYGSLLKIAHERIALPMLLPFFTKVAGEIHHPMRYGKPKRLVAVGGLPAADPESEDLFQEVVHRNALNFHNLTSPTAVVYASMAPAEVALRVSSVAEGAGSPS